jgi:hypothetical protein
MIDPAVAAPHLTPDQLAALIDTMEGADSVELKVTVPDRERRSAVSALGMDPLDAEIRQVYFFDTPDLTLNKQGVIVRARRTQSGDDTIVKLRPVVPGELSKELRSQKGFGVEVDAMPGGFVCSARLRSKLKAGAVKKALGGGGGIESLLGKRQRAFYASCVTDGPAIAELTPLGPINVLKLTFRPPGYDGRMVAELWMYPDGSRILELSTKASTTEAFEVAARTRAYLAECGLDLSGEQQTKTKIALEFFAAEAQPS